MPRKGPIFQDHHVIEQQTFRNSDLLKALEKSGLVEKDAFENRINMPADPQLAHAMGVSPHSGGPIKEYQRGIAVQLEKLAETADGQAALDQDVDAMRRIAARVNHLRDTMTVGLINGDLYTNAPFGLSADDIRPRTQTFLHGIHAYGRANAEQISALSGYSSVDRSYLSVTKTESRIITVLEFAQQSGNKLTKGDDLRLQSDQLTQAIANAHQDGRVVFSEKGIQTVEESLGREAADALRGPRGQQGYASIDLLVGDARVGTLVRAGGLLTTGVDGALAARRASELLDQGNATAARSEVTHAVARNVGGWAGGTSLAMALGGSGFVPAAAVAADALLLAKAFEKGADLLDNRAIYHQTVAGVEWKFDGVNWTREAAFDRAQEGRSNPTEERVAASYQQSQKLGALASAKAVEFALGKVPPPQDPFKIPAQPSDQRGLDNQDWRHNPDTATWERRVKTAFTGANDRASYETQTATPERARQLNQEALGRIEENIATGREAIATYYLENHAAQRSQEQGVAVPEAVEYARARPDAVLGSDNRLYHRDETGQWANQGALASGNLAMELELTNQMRLLSIERAEESIAAIQALPPPTAAQVAKNELLHTYRSAGVDLNVNPDTQQAIELAVSRTREANGIPGPTMQQIQRNDAGVFGYDSPIAHFQTGEDGVARHVATTSSEELRQALRDVRAVGQQQSPIPGTPVLEIAALSPQERDAYQQAMSEANRQGGSAEEVQHVATLAAVSVHASTPELARAPQERGADHAPADLSAPVLQQQTVTVSPAAVTLPAAALMPDQGRVSSRGEKPPAEVSEPAISHTSAHQGSLVGQHGHDQAAEQKDPTPEARPAARAGAIASHSSPQSAAYEHAGASGAHPDHAPQQVRGARLPQHEDNAGHVDESPRVLGNPAVREQATLVTPVEVERKERRAPEETALPYAADTPSDDQVLERSGFAFHETRPVRLSSNDLPAAKPAPQTAGSDHTPLEGGVWAPTQQDAERNQAWPSKPDHPDYPLFQQIRGGVAAVDAEYGRTFDATSERMSASLFVLAKGNGLTRADHVVMSSATATSPEAEFVFLVEGDIGDPAGRRASMRTRQAVETPVEEAMQQLEAQNQEQQQLQAQQMEQQAQGQQAQLEANARVMALDGDGGGGGGE